MILLRASVVFLVLGTSAVAHAFDWSRPADNACLEEHSKTWCLLATRGFGHQLTDVPAPPAETEAVCDLGTGRAVSQGVTAGGVALHARAAVGIDPSMLSAKQSLRPQHK